MCAREFTSSQAFTAVKTGFHRFTAFGAGGGGEASAAYGATGGGAGAVSQKTLWLNRGDIVEIAVGAKGTRGNKPYSGTAQAATAGGDTSVTGAGFEMVAGGGGPGKLAATLPLLQQGVSGGTGGKARGGDLNIDGGNGGSILPRTAGTYFATGGGAVSLAYGCGFDGGNILTDTTSTIFATGGAGVGGKGEDSAPGSNLTYSAGGPAIRVAADQANTYFAIFADVKGPLTDWVFDAVSVGAGTGVGYSNAGSSTGSQDQYGNAGSGGVGLQASTASRMSGSILTSGSTINRLYKRVLGLSGTGGAAGTLNGSGLGMAAGNCAISGGGGGACGSPGSNGGLAGGNGGAGLVVVEF